jgi:hypothetical protein
MEELTVEFVGTLNFRNLRDIPASNYVAE